MSENLDFKSIINRKGYFSVKHEFSEKNFIPMSIADMDLPCAKPIQDAIIKRVNHPIYGYTFQPLSMWKAVQKWLKSEQKWDVDMDSFVFTPNLVTATVNCVRTYTNPLDGILVMLPLYSPLQTLVQKENRHLIKYHLELNLETNQYCFNLKKIEELIKTKHIKMLIFCSPHNPSGRVWKKSELTQLAKLCKIHNVFILSDEIHADLTLKPTQKPYYSMGKICSYPSINFKEIIVLSSPSKTWNLGGIQCGFLVISDKTLMKKYMRHVEHTYGHYGSIFATTTMIASYTMGKPYLLKLKKHLQSNIELLKTCFLKIAPEINIIFPDASYLVWLDCREFCKKRDLKGKDALINFFIQKAKIQLSSGYSFGGSKYEYFCRINIGVPTDLLKKVLDNMTTAILN